MFKYKRKARHEVKSEVKDKMNKMYKVSIKLYNKNKGNLKCFKCFSLFICAHFC